VYFSFWDLATLYMMNVLKHFSIYCDSHLQGE
jgi:hypothetical protein